MVNIEVVKITPRGYCHGVVHAINQLRDILKDKTINRPVYILGKVVHNQKIVDDFSNLGLITLDEKGKSRLQLLDEIEKGTVVFTAHGVSEQVYEKARQKNLDIIDTTCKDVMQSQNTIKKYLHDGYKILFIGKKDHPEVETALSYDDVYLIEKPRDIHALSFSKDTKIAMTNQTTMSIFDVYHLNEAIKKKYPSVVILDEICDATKLRQLAIKHQPKDIDFCYVVGDPYSNNSNKLVQVSINSGVPARLIESVEDINTNHLKNIKKVSVTSGASTPTQITNEVIHFLNHFKDQHANQRPKSQYKTTNLFKP